MVSALAVALSSGCDGRPGGNLTRMIEARRLAADLMVQFTKNADAGNMAVMADTDEASAAYVRDAQAASAAVVKDRDALAALLGDLGYSAETDLLEEFGRRFTQYESFDKEVLALAVENTNLKAQRLSFGEAQMAADAFRDALTPLKPARAGDAWQVQALVATAVAAVREMQMLQAPHIAESGDEAMSRLEKRAAAAEMTARTSLDMLSGVAGIGGQSQLTSARTALDRFIELNGQIVSLSRRNSNVRSLALSLGQKRMLSATCEDSIKALQDALSQRTFAGTR